MIVEGFGYFGVMCAVRDNIEIKGIVRYCFVIGTKVIFVIKGKIDVNLTVVQPYTTLVNQDFVNIDLLNLNTKISANSIFVYIINSLDLVGY